MSFKENPNNKWRQEFLNSQSNKQHLSITIRKLKLNTIYYFKIQARNNRAYGSSSPTIIFKMPNAKGEGGGKIFIQDEASVHDTTVEAQTKTAAQDTSQQSVIRQNLSLNKKQDSHFLLSKSSIEMNMIWIIAASVSSLLVLVFILLAVFVCKRATSKAEEKAEIKRSTLRSYEKAKSSSSSSANNNGLDNEDGVDEMEVESLYHQNQQHQQQKQLLSCNTNYQVPHDWLNTNESTLIIAHSHQQQQQQQASSNSRTPIHHHYHHQPLQISNPNHMVMTLMSNSNSNSHTNHNTSEMDFYSNGANPEANAVESFYAHHQHQHQHQNGEDRFSQLTGGGDSDLTNTSAAIAAANAAFNAPFSQNSGNMCNLNEQQQQTFMRHTIRPKPIAIPLNTTSSTTLSTSPSPLTSAQNEGQQSFFIAAGPHRKSFKNLPIATATLISSSNQANQQQASNETLLKHQPTTTPFFTHHHLQQQQQQGPVSQKLHYTARPYIIDNQVQSSYVDYPTSSNHHSPASSSHSSQPPVYDKIGNINSKSLLQPLKSFAPSSMSIPNTPAKYCENSNFMMNMTRSPAKKIMLGTSSTRIAAAGNKSTVDITAKSIENIFESKKLSTNHGENVKEELTVEMANLEGIMKDLSAITAQQFEC